MSGQREEDLLTNPFMRDLRRNFEGLYKRAADRGDTIICPCADCLEGEVTQYFAEAHLLSASHVPGCFMNLLGQGVEIKDSSVATHLGFQESRTCEVLVRESIYDFGNTFSVLVTDKPLVGKYKIIPGLADRAPKSAAAATGASAASSSVGGADVQDMLSSAPAIEHDFFDQVDRFRKTFVQVPGCEQSTAERIREIVGNASKRLFRHHEIKNPSQQHQLEYQVSRKAYAALQSFVFPHLEQILLDPEEKLQNGIKLFATTADLIASLPDATARGLGDVDIRSCAEKLSDISHQITPHEKISCIDEAHSLLHKCVADGARAGRSAEGVFEITGDDVISLFTMAVHKSKLKKCLAHIAHVEMYTQGEAARLHESGYAVAALQSAFKFFLEERRHTGPGASRGGSGGASAGSRAGSMRPTADIFSSYLQPGPQGPSSFGEDDLNGLVRQAGAAQFRR